ncbi:hypothetical protein [Pseudomonas umsongensis]
MSEVKYASLWYLPAFPVEVLVVLDAEHLAQAMQDIDALWEAFYAQAGEVKNASA